MKILVVEDDTALGNSLEKGLRESGFEVWRASSARAARASLSEQMPELVVLDLGLPDEDGFQLLEEWRGCS